MAVYKRGYSRYEGERTGHWRRMMTLPRYSWRRLLQQRLVVLLLTASLIWPLLCGGFIYLSNHLELWSGLGGGVTEMMEINARFFVVFMNVQSVFSVLLAALAGPGLIAPDLANNALPLYLSRPLTRLDYVAARLMVLVGLLSMVTWVPGLALFGLQSGMAGWTWTAAHWRLAGGVVAGFLVWILLVSMVALASSAYVKWKLVAGGLVLGFFFVLAGVAQMVNSVFRVDWGSLLNPSRSVYRLWVALLGGAPPDGPGTLASVVALAVCGLLLAAVLERKLRPVEVIR